MAVLIFVALLTLYLSYSCQDNNSWFQTIVILWVLYSFLWWFPGVWILCVDVSEHSVHTTYKDWAECSETFIHLLVSHDRFKFSSKASFLIVRSRASSFRWEYSLLSLRSFSSLLRLIPRLPITSISPFTFPSVTCCRAVYKQNVTNPVNLPFAFVLPKRRHIKFRHRAITQKKEYNKKIISGWEWMRNINVLKFAVPVGLFIYNV
jgi:hypothetical protein